MLKSSRSNEIAILGYGCRLPGADGPDEFWRVLEEGRCTVTEIQGDRWAKAAFGHPDPAMRGKSYVWAAGQLDDPWAFDPDFFGISPREAEQMDPQQRLILQVAWEALEHAGLPPSTLPKDRTGVYIGASSSDYSNRFYLDPASIDSQFMTGNSPSLLSNRVSYVLDLHGPSQTIDTACSSGLYALHHAAEAIRAGLIDTALVGAVNLLLSPFPFIGFSRASMLSKRGLCRAFDADGDGYVRSEGAAVFVLRAEDAAVAGGDRIRGYIAATGVNTDGRTPGVSQPSADRQAALLRAVYEGGDIDPNDLAFVEAHGTGTAVGDPIEASAIGAVLGVRRERPLPIGSVKTNVGHLEAGAGMVGLLKAQMALERGAAPRSLHFETPNPNIDFEGLNLKVVEDAIPLPEAAATGPRLAGVNSFGFGGANGHAVLRRAAPARPPRRAAPAPLILSARSEESLARLAESYARRLAGATDAEAAEIANAAAWRRERLPHRLVAPVLGREAQVAALEAYAADPETPGVAAGQAAAGPVKTAFVFSGNGAQWAGMGREAYRDDPVFRSVFDEVSALHARRHDDDLAEALNDPALGDRLGRTSLAQPLLFAVQAGLVVSLAEAGLHPDFVIGHSVGEVAAAWAAGIYPLEDAVRLIGIRSANQEMLRGRGQMAAVAAPADEIEARLADAGLGEIWVAADNSPRGATVSGSAAALDAFEALAEAEKWPVKRLALDYPFHSGFADPMRDALIADLDWLKPEEARIGFVSTAYGRPADGHELGPAYWWKNIRRPVRFREGVLALAEAGCGVFVEIGPKPLLRGYLRDSLAAADVPLRHAPTLDEAGGDVATTVARALALGAAVDEARVFGQPAPAPVDLPRYPWRNRRYRAEDTPEAARILAPAGASPLLGPPVRPDAHDWRREIDPASPAWMADHVVQGAVVAPAAAMIEMAFAAGLAALGEDEDGAHGIELKNFSILRPIALDGGAREVRVALSGPRAALRIDSRRRLSEEAWSPAATGRLRRAYAAPPAAPPVSGDAARAPAEPVYEAFERRGLAYGPAFRLMRDVAIDGGAAEATLAAPEDAAAHALHPASLDAALHGLLALLEADGCDRLFLPVSVETARLFRRGAEIRAARATVTRRSERSVRADILLFDADGAVAASFEGFRFKAAPGAAALDPDACRYETRLVPIPTPGAERGGFAGIVDWGREAGLLADQPVDPDPAALIAEAAAQRVVLDALAGDPEADAARLRRMAESAGLLTRDADGRSVEIAEAAPPELSPLLEALIAEAPRSAGLIAWLSRLAAGTPGDDLAPTRAERALLARDAAAERRWNTLAGLAVEALARPDAPEGPSVLLLGAPAAPAVRALADTPLRRLWIVDPDGEPEAKGPPRPALAQRRGAAALEDGPSFDLVLVADASGAPATDALALAASSLAPGGAILALSPPDGLLRDLASGGRAALRAPAGLTASERAFVSDGELAVFRRPAAAPGDADPRSPIRVVETPGVGALRDALATALDRRGLAAPAGAGHGAEAVLLAGDGARSRDVAERMMAAHPLLAVPPAERPPRLWIVTQGGAPADGEGASPGDAALWGCGRVLANEHPDTDIRLVDLDPEAGVAENAARLAAHLAEPGEEREIALRGGRSFALRVRRALPPAPEGTQLRLDQARPGDIESLAWRPAPLRAPEGDEIEIEVAAAGLNFRDVMWAQGLLPEEALEDGFAGPTLGMECAGTVSAVGPEATRFRPGDKVIAYAPACFAQRVLAPETAAAPVPDGVDPEIAASIPAAFLTAQYALAELARLAPGETVLIHGAAGGVGLAAIQIAAARGARAIVTAGSPAKRALALRLGAEAAFDGRSLGFADAVMAATGGAGVDVVLNSLAGEAMERGVECLKPFGRFVELGKRDFYADSELGLRPFRRNLGYFGVDADQLMQERPEIAARVLADLGEMFAQGALAPPPATLFDAEDAVAAFRLMQKSGHVGKILIRPPLARPAAPPAPPIRPDAAYLVVGGVSGFGAATAEWLARRGARRLHLSSRTAAPDLAGAAAIERMRAMGAEVSLHAADVADEDAMRGLLAEIAAAGATLRGIVHAAMVLDDALYAAQDRGRIERVLRPKIDGVATLDRLTRARAAGPGGALDFFVAYSSATTLVGNPGQCAYVAANAGVEAIMRARRADGLPGLAIAWGAVSDAGVLAREAETDATLATRLGASRMTAADALEELGRLLGDPRPVHAFGDIDWAAAARELRLLETPLFELLEVPDEASDAPSGEVVDRLRGLAPGEAQAALVEMLAGEAAKILRMPPGEIEPGRALTDMGFDSLMAMDLRMALEERIGLDVPLMSLAGGATLSDVARLALEKLGAGEEAGGPAADPVVDLVVERHVSGAEDGVTRDDVAAFAKRARSTESLLS